MHLPPPPGSLDLAIAVVDAGNYINAYKAIPVLVLLLVWARLLTWVDKDAPAAHLPRESINLGFLGGLILATAGFLLLPGFWIGLLVFLFVMGAQAGIYLSVRNKRVGLGDLKKQFHDFLHPKKEGTAEAAAGSVAIITPKGVTMSPPGEDEPDRAAYDATQTILSDPLKKSADRVDVAPAEGGAKVRYNVDGMNYDGPILDRAVAAEAITYLKLVADLNVEELRKPQKGNFRVNMDGKRREAQVQTSGTSAGEMMRIEFDLKKRQGLRLEELGMEPDALKVVQDAIKDGKGIVLLASPKGQGLTSLLYAILRGHDAFLEHIHTIERCPDQDLEGITQNALEKNAGPAEELKLVDWVTSQMPHIVAVSSIENGGTAATMVKYSTEDDGHRVYVCVKAANGFEALSQWRKLVGDDRKAVANLKMVVSSRVMRKLCVACKVAFAPDPDVLRKLGINPATAGQMYQARKEPVRDEKGNPVPCEFCHELRFKGRFGVYEVLSLTGEIREAIAGGASVAQLTALFRKQKARFLKEVAFAKVADGDTSIQEVIRVMQGETPAAPAKSAEARPAARPAAAAQATRPSRARPPA